MVQLSVRKAVVVRVRARVLLSVLACAAGCNDVLQSSNAGTGAPMMAPIAGTGAGTGVVAGGTGGVAGTVPIEQPTAGMSAATGGMSGGMSGGTAGMTVEMMPPIEVPVETPVIEGPVLMQNIIVAQVPPGGQLTVCTTKILDNETEVKVKAVRGYISPGSHHFIVDRAPTDVALQGLVPCVGLSGADSTRVMIAEKPETTFAMPTGVAFTMRPHQPLTMELHYFNPTETAMDVHAEIEFVLAEGEELVGLREASMVFTGSTAISLPAHAPGSSEFFTVLPGTPQNPVHVFAMTSHTHALGVRATIERTANAFAAGQMVHESLSWAEPPFDEYAPALVFTGSDGLKLKCEYNNTTDVPVGFGTRVQDEMCFMWLYYYTGSAL